MLIALSQSTTCCFAKLTHLTGLLPKATALWVSKHLIEIGHLKNILFKYIHSNIQNRGDNKKNRFDYMPTYATKLILRLS